MLEQTWDAVQMTRGNEKFLRRQKEVARQKRQEEKRRARLARKDERPEGGTAGDDDVAEIQAAMDAGLNPGSEKDRQD
jgi:hypothetical protein